MLLYAEISVLFDNLNDNETYNIYTIVTCELTIPNILKENDHDKCPLTLTPPNTTAYPAE